MGAVILGVENLCVDYAGLRAVDAVSFEVHAGESVGLVGGSGCGKTSLARAVLRLIESRGRIVWRGRELDRARGRSLRALREGLQMIFQDARASLDPRLAIGDAIAEPLRVRPSAPPRGEIRHRVGEMLRQVGLEAAMAGRRPHELSGGQCQRVAIARAMIAEPRLVICDEPVSSLDVSVQGQIVNLLEDLRRDRGVALLFISHNLAVVRQLCPRILVMAGGRIVESGTRERLFESPAHPYTRELLAAIPRLRYPPGP